jgi:hypothetical protein
MVHGIANDGASQTDFARARLSKNSFAGNDGGIFPLFVGLVM